MINTQYNFNYDDDNLIKERLKNSATYITNDIKTNAIAQNCIIFSVTAVWAMAERPPEAIAPIVLPTTNSGAIQKEFCTKLDIHLTPQTKIFYPFGW